jgi:hypothetical protein
VNAEQIDDSRIVEAAGNDLDHRNLVARFTLPSLRIDLSMAFPHQSRCMRWQE